MILATICYIKNDNKTLMLHRVKKQNDVHEGKWVGLGGKMEQGETPEECIIREIKEESGLDVPHPLLKGVLTFPKFKDNEDWLVFVYVATYFEGQLLEESNEGNLEWIDDAKVLELNLWEGDRLFLKWLEGEQIFSAKLEYIEGSLCNHSVVFY